MGVIFIELRFHVFHSKWLSDSTISIDLLTTTVGEY